MANEFVDVKVKASYLDSKGIAHVKADSGGSGRASDYRTLMNKPKINNITLNGNRTLKDLGIQPEGDYATLSDIPTKNSELENDSNFITSEDASQWYVTTDKETQEINGVKTFNAIPELNANLTPTTDSQFVNKKYVDDNSSSIYLGNANDTSFQNPIDITGLKKGVYIFNNESRSTLHISATIHGVKSTTTFSSILADRGFPFVGPIFLELYKDIDDNITPNSTLGCFSFSYYNHNDYKINVGIRMLNADSAYYIGTGSGSGYGVNLVLKDKNITITGTHTYNTLPQSSIVPSSNNQLVNKKYVDDSISQAISSALGGDY